MVSNHIYISRNPNSQHVVGILFRLEYKEEHKLIDFDDMLLKTLEYGLTPNADFLFVDEFQDFTPLLYKIFNLFKSDIDEVYVAGDDDQTIYNFAGATPDYWKCTWS